MKAPEKLLAGALLFLLFAQLVYGLRTDGLTDDEIVYMGAGHRHLHGDFRINPEQPPLAKMLGAATFAGLSLERPPIVPGEDQCGWSYRFVHLRNRQAPLLSRARFPVVLLTVALAGAIAFAAWRAGGVVAGLLALTLAVFQPAFLAHGHLITTDMPGAVLLTAAVLMFGSFLRRPNAWKPSAVAVLLALAMLARLTSMILLPIFAVIAVVEWRRAADRRAFARWLAVLAVACVLLVPLVIWAAYGFRYAPFDGDPGVYGGWPRSTAGQVLSWVAQHKLLPQAFIEGVRFQIEHNAGGHAGYLLGDRGSYGWWYYYLVVLVAKNTPGFLALLAVAAWLTVRRRVTTQAPLWHWLLTAGLIFVAASLGRIQIGERYIVTIYPFLILWIAIACAPLLASRAGRIGVGLAVAVHAASALAAAGPGYLTYFNPLAARAAAQGKPWVADSNLDWGQDLPRLAEWMRREGVAKVQLGYFGSDDPDRYGIAHEDLPTWHSHHPMHSPGEPFHGTVAVSPNLLLGFLMPPGRSPYDFLLEREPDARAGIFFIYRLGPVSASGRP